MPKAGQDREQSDRDPGTSQRNEIAWPNEAPQYASLTRELPRSLHRSAFGFEWRAKNVA